jgi:hypothetical protein
MYQEGCFTELKSSHFSLSKRATFLLSFAFLSLSTSHYREFHSGALVQGWRDEWIFLLPFPLFPPASIKEANLFTWLYP